MSRREGRRGAEEGTKTEKASRGKENVEASAGEGDYCRGEDGRRGNSVVGRRGGVKDVECLAGGLESPAQLDA